MILDKSSDTKVYGMTMKLYCVKETIASLRKIFDVKSEQSV